MWWRHRDIAARRIAPVVDPGPCTGAMKAGAPGSDVTRHDARAGDHRPSSPRDPRSRQGRPRVRRPARWATLTREQPAGRRAMATFDYDVVIIGSGFGGSVSALRAAEKGYRVGVMESGKRWNDEDIPKSQWHLPGFLWFPASELYGIQRVEYLYDVLVLCGAGVGGGSHVYANTLYVPPKQFFDAPEWAGITDWADELAPHIDQATRMLGVVRYPYMTTDVDRVMQQVATEMGRGETFNQAPLGVYFGSPGVEADDPYFG